LNSRSRKKMANRFYAITRRVAQERSVISGMVISAQTGFTIRAPPRSEPCSVKHIDLFARRSLETPVAFRNRYLPVVEIHRKTGRRRILRRATLAVPSACGKS
jgi:hypothetical protein